MKANNVRSLNGRPHSLNALNFSLVHPLIHLGWPCLVDDYQEKKVPQAIKIKILAVDCSFCLDSEWLRIYVVCSPRLNTVGVMAALSSLVSSTLPLANILFPTDA